MFRHRIGGVLRSVSGNDTNLSSTESNTLKQLKKDESIIIAPADKGCAVVVMNKTDYKQKIDDHLPSNDKRPNT